MGEDTNQQVSVNSIPKVDYDCNIFSVLMQIFNVGDTFTKLSFLIMGMSNLVRGQIVKGLMFLATEIGFFIFMIKYGFHNLVMMISLGKVAYIETIDKDGFPVREVQDQSLKILLFGVCTALIVIGFIIMWKANIKSGYEAQYAMQRGKRPKSIIRDIMDLFDSNLHKTMLFLPMTGVLAFTIAPLIFMILIAFTNFDSKEHNGLMQLFQWIGLQNFKDVLGMSDAWGTTFWRVLGWTLIWAVFATFTCYIGGMLLAMLINRKGIKYKGLWRTMFVISAAVPQFVSLLLISKLFGDTGAINNFLLSNGIISEYIHFLSDITNARILVIIVNFWVGVPYTMLIMTGILMNIPADLYESAKIDGANNAVMFFKITLPYMIFVTTPHLITTFIGNINNFNVIYLLTGGGPNFGELYMAGSTDLLVTWLYSLTKDQGLYGYASTIGILIFIISASFSLITYRRSGSYKNEEEFQ